MEIWKNGETHKAVPNFPYFHLSIFSSFHLFHVSLMDTLIVLLKQKKFKKAEVFLRNSLAENPNDIYSLAQLANILWILHKDTEALEYSDKAKKLNPVYPLLNYTRGRILWSLESYEQSIAEWNIILGMSLEDVARNGYGVRWAKSVINDARYYKADCLYHLFRDNEAQALVEEHLKHRCKGIESDFSKKEVVLFYKVLKYSHPRIPVKETDEGYASEYQRKLISRRIDVLDKANDLSKLVVYLKDKCKRYPKEYYLKTVLSEYYKILGKESACLECAKDAFDMEPYDPLVKYNYAVALMFNGRNDEALRQFNEIVALGEDFIAFSEHGEGLRWARRILRDTRNNIEKLSFYR